MNCYEPSVPRVVLGFAAIAMTALTIVASVILPANMDSDSRASQMVVTSRLTGPYSAGSAPGIDVSAAHDAKAEPIPCTFIDPDHKPEARERRFHVVKS
jgi:hypothetical protein